MRYHEADYDVVVVGAGHAGAEAGLAAARMGHDVLVLTINLDSTGAMPCNPAVGGPAKGHLVREIDALGGEMARAIDDTYVQIRTLNTGKGPAVQSLRAQADKNEYSQRILRALMRQPRLRLKEAMVDGLVVSGGRICGITTKTGMKYGARAVIITAGVYLRGRVFTGEYGYESGPNGLTPAVDLSSDLAGRNMRMGRFMTGTPPRIARDTIDTSKMQRQEGDREPRAFSFMSAINDPLEMDLDAGGGEREQLACWLTHTSDDTGRIVRENIGRTPMYDGTMESAGPRYCPCLEDKIMRFPDRPSHPVFLEPEGRDSEEMYVQGLSTSLPEDVQIQALRSIPGLQAAEIVRPGYGIEYDYLDPTELHPSLQSKSIPGLFCAGQINGTSGYEEAAAQGIMAGINAALFLRERDPLVLDRSQAYIGVLIDDLVTKGVDEPYRMLTSRAEYRLLLRQDNADFRLTELGREVGLVSEERYGRARTRRSLVEDEIERLRETRVKCDEHVNRHLRSLGTSPLREAASLARLLRRPEVDYDSLAEIDEQRPDLSRVVREAVEIDIKYEGYIEKQEDQVRRYLRSERTRIPHDINYGEVPGLSSEAREKLGRVMPRSLGQAMRIPGVSPADVSVLMVWIGGNRGGESS